MSDSASDGATDVGQAEAPPAEVTDWQAEAKRWQAEAEKEQRLKRKVENQNKANADKIERLEAASLSDQEKAVAAAVQAAKDETRTETMRQLGHRLVDAEVKAAAAGRSVDVDALLEGLDRSRFLGDDLEPDTAAISQWVDRITPKRDATGFDIGQGARGNGGDKADLAFQDEFMKTIFSRIGPPRG
jgi:hypothetical protein